MAIDNPMYIGENALHRPGSIRLLSYGLTTGQQGVLGTTDLRVTALGTPGSTVQVQPGAFNALARHLGGSYESYAGKINVAESSPTISSTTSSGARSDLVILRVEDPYVSGAGSWPVPSDPVNGPYAFIRVIENVPATTWDHRQLTTLGGDTWTAITLGRIDRPANTGVVQQSHIVDLRSLAQLGGTRTVVIDNPPTEIPPIASEWYQQFKASAGDPNYGKPSGATDTVHDYLNADTAVKNWPAIASFPKIAVPSWAVEVDIEMVVSNAQIVTGDVYGKFWVDLGGVATTVQTYAIDYVQVPSRHNLIYGLTMTVPNSIRGKIITARPKFQSYYTANGKLDAKAGTVTKLTLHWQRKPDA